MDSKFVVDDTVSSSSSTEEEEEEEEELVFVYHTLLIHYTYNPSFTGGVVNEKGCGE